MENEKSNGLETSIARTIESIGRNDITWHENEKLDFTLILLNKWKGKTYAKFQSELQETPYFKGLERGLKDLILDEEKFREIALRRLIQGFHQDDLHDGAYEQIIAEYDQHLTVNKAIELFREGYFACGNNRLKASYFRLGI